MKLQTDRNAISIVCKMGFNRTCGIKVVRGEVYTSEQLRELFKSLCVKIEKRWEDEDCEDGKVPKLMFWNDFSLPDGRVVFNRGHFSGDSYLVGSVVSEIKDLYKLSYSDHLYVYDMCYPDEEWVHPHLTVMEVLEMPPLRKKRYCHKDTKNNMFVEEDDVVVTKKELRYNSTNMYYYEYVKLGCVAIEFLKKACVCIEDESLDDENLYLVADGDCTCCS